MNPLMLLGWVGLPAYVTGSVLNTATLKDPNLQPKIWGMDARAVIGGLGLLGAVLFGGPVGLVAAGATIGAGVSWDGGRKVRMGLSMQALDQAQAQANTPMTPQLVPALPGPAPVPPVQVPSAVPAEDRSIIERLFAA